MNLPVPLVPLDCKKVPLDPCKTAVLPTFFVVYPADKSSMRPDGSKAVSDTGGPTSTSSRPEDKIIVNM